ncbi:MAG TPA: ABC transporter ATP-binding protein [Cellulomonas sp.]|uniref:ABC transporter ATP-binding protein n=1 Tax=Cellulomonas sp. TaxID=40001 RepID=UPI002E32D85B|nr:ABC transporter ATP-binding protein [Cellulomonas sp.]HEX5333835.1 ABC transporter ATP-binding protein [Cellulomonas sp.]
MRQLPLPHPGPAPLTSPAALLWWQARHQQWLLLASITCGIVGNVAAAALPYVLGRIIDGGLTDGLSRTLWLGCAAFGAVGLVQVGANVWGHRLDVENWLRAAYATSQLIGHHVTRTGDAVTAELPTGEVVATVASDALRIGEVYAVAARFVGGIVAYAAVAVVLMRTSLTLGLLVLLGLPVVVSVLALLVKPLQRRQATQREAAGRLTTLGADTVSGLRILRGIGGEEVFAGRYRAQSELVRRAGVGVAQTQSLLDALQTLLPGLFLAAVVWVGAHLALAGEISPGQLVAFYGFAAFLTQPLWTATEAMRVMTRAVVGCRKIIKVLEIPEAGADSADRRAAVAATSPARTEALVDERSGLVVRPGALLALVSANPDEAARLATRLGRFRAPTGSGADDDESLGEVRWGAALLRELHLREVRDRIVVAESTPHLFTGVLADELDVRGRATESDLLQAMHVADAADVLDSVPGGLAGAVEEKGRSLSGGQRQRVALARALLTEAEVLVLVEPTSAVDAHTEARIARRLAQARRGRTTVLVTASPLVLDVVEEVVLIEDGRVLARGSHRELLAATDSAGRAYRAVVSRGHGPTNPTGPTDDAREEARHEAARR